MAGYSVARWLKRGLPVNSSMRTLAILVIAAALAVIAFTGYQELQDDRERYGLQKSYCHSMATGVVQLTLRKGQELQERHWDKAYETCMATQL